MPAQLSYPGVYIEEVPSGVRTITGVATSITAFVGRTRRGPIDEPTTIFSFGDFERIFGGLWYDHPLSYAVRDFYANGGGEAIIVRLFKASEVDNATAKVEHHDATLDNDLVLKAASPGAWGNNLRMRIDHDVATEVLPWMDADGITVDELFNLSVHDTESGATETFRNLTLTDSLRKVENVLNDGSSLVRYESHALVAPALRPDKHADLPNGASSSTIWTTEQDDVTPGLSSGVATPVPQSDPALDDWGSLTDKTGLYALEKADLFNLLCIPPDERDTPTTPVTVYQAALKYCVDRRAMLLVDPPADWNTRKKAKDGLAGLGLNGTAARNAALYFPRIKASDPMRGGRDDTFVPCGVVAGIMARTDAQRGVWKAPAGLDAGLNGTSGLEVQLTDGDNGVLNPLGINCLRSFPVFGRVVWGSRTLRGADVLADEYKYVPVRRLVLFLEESLYRGTQWVVFEPNDEPLWSQIRLNLGAFMHNLFRQGAFQGSSPQEAYFVKCDAETTTQNDINLGVVNIVVGFAPLKPAEFVVVRIQQMAGQINA